MVDYSSWLRASTHWTNYGRWSYALERTWSLDPDRPRFGFLPHGFFSYKMQITVLPHRATVKIKWGASTVCWYLGAWGQCVFPYPTQSKLGTWFEGNRMNSEVGHAGGEASGEQWVGPKAEVGAWGTGLGVISLGALCWGLGVRKRDRALGEAQA